MPVTTNDSQALPTVALPKTQNTPPSLLSLHATSVATQPLTGWLDKHPNDALHCTSIAFSSNGHRAVAVYGRKECRGWCSTTGGVTVWHTALGQVECSTGLDACPVSASFHPVLPDMVAIGGYNGELCLLHCASGESVRIVYAGAGDLTHRTAIVALVWVPLAPATASAMRTAVPGGWLLLTVAADGGVLTWNPHNVTAPLAAMELKCRPAKDAHMHVCTPTAAAGPPGCTGLLEHMGPVLVVGTEGGQVCKYTLPVSANDLFTTSRTTCNPTNTSSTITNNVTSPATPMNVLPEVEYDGHAAAVSAVKFSPFQRQIFASASVDNTVRVYSTTHSAALLVVEPMGGMSVTSLHWSPLRPTVFGVGCGNGQLQLFNLQTSLYEPVHTLEAGPGMVHQFALHPTQPRMLLTASAAGTKLWQLPAWLGHSAEDEVGNLQELLVVG